MTLSITHTIPLLEELHATLDQAYWESSSIQGKDMVYDIISMITKELSELSKLSVQDHDLEYEPICHEFKVGLNKLPQFRKHIDDVVDRSSTANKLDNIIYRTLSITKNKPD